jgi:hypothetical protein
MRGGSVGIKVNDDIGHYFQSKKDLRQGDPLSSILFNLVVDMLATLIERAKELGIFGGVIPHLIHNGLSILQYADEGGHSGTSGNANGSYQGFLPHPENDCSLQLG